MALFDNWTTATLTGRIENVVRNDDQTLDSPLLSLSHRSRLDMQQNLDDEDDMFTVEKLHSLQSQNDTAVMMCARAASNILSSLNSRRVVVRRDLVNDSRQEWIASRRSADKSYSLFVDATSSHTIVSFDNGHAVYLHASLKKPHSIAITGCVIQCVFWTTSLSSSSTTTELAILGTRSGTLYQFDMHSKDMSLIKLFDVPDGETIYGFQCESFPATNDATTQAWLGMLATRTRLFQFVGGPTIREIFQSYSDDEVSFIEISGDLLYSELHFYREERAKSVAWLTGAGIYHGKLSFERGRQSNTLIEDYKLVAFPGNTVCNDDLPVSICVTKFHFLLLYRHRLVAINQMSSEVVFETQLPVSFGDMIGIIQDNVMHSIFLYSGTTICEVIVKNEKRDMWRLYLKEKKFDEALDSCPNAMRHIVLNTHGDFLFDQGKYLPAAALYSHSHRSFEEISLKFLSAKAHIALKAFLRNRLALAPLKDLTQRTMICTWLTEIYLDQISSTKTNINQTSTHIVEEFMMFLDQYRCDLDRDTTFELISSHGRVDELLMYAEFIGEHDFVVNYHIQHRNYEQSLSALSKSNDDERIYKFAPVLLEHLPKQMLHLLQSRSSLDPARLLPALMRYDGSAAGKRDRGTDDDVALAYLEGALRNECVDASVHNYLVSLYVQLNDNGQRLLIFIHTQIVPIFDLKYALRLCHQEKLTTACVRLYERMHLYQEAVTIALGVSLDLAKEVASNLDDSHPDKKALWLQIARYIIEKHHNIREAFGVLKQCAYLSLDDILPYVPDDVCIKDFQQEIVDTLQDYNTRLDDLKREMDGFTKSADSIRENISALRHRSLCVSDGQSCQICNISLLSKKFYLYPCSHAFHTSCADKRIAQMQAMRDRVGKPSRTFFDSDSESENERAYEEVLYSASTECILCGDAMIDSIDVPFLQSSSDAKDRWEI